MLQAEALDMLNLTARQVTDLCPEAAGEIELHERGCPIAGQTKDRAGVGND